MKGVYSAGYISVHRDDPGYLKASIDLEGCPSSDIEFFSRCESLRSASLHPNGEGSAVYCDAMVIEIGLEDGRVAFIDGNLDAPPPDDEGHTGHFLGMIRVADAAHADEARNEALQEHDASIAGETVSDLRMLVTRLEGIEIGVLTARHSELTDLTDQLNRILAKVA